MGRFPQDPHQPTEARRAPEAARELESSQPPRPDSDPRERPDKRGLRGNQEPDSGDVERGHEKIDRLLTH